MKKWPLTIEQRREAAGLLYRKLSFEKAMRKYSKGVEDIGGVDFTHRCICPNEDHKGGNERTPSFYFSEESKRFVCFGCKIQGDLFDILARLEGIPWFKIIDIFIEREGVDVDNLDGSGELAPIDYNYAYNAKFDLSIILRDHLLSFVGKPGYEDERRWVDRMFKRIDERFEKIDKEDVVKAREYSSHVKMELDRRKKMHLRKVGKKC